VGSFLLKGEYAKMKNYETMRIWFESMMGLFAIDELWKGGEVSTEVHDESIELLNMLSEAMKNTMK